jgi:hypothetical protein
MKQFMKSLIATATCMLCAACGGSPGPSNALSVGGPSGTITWLPRPEYANPLPGIDQGTVYRMGTVFVIWSDAVGGGGGSSTGNAQGIKGKGDLHTQDHRQIEFRVETKDSKTGQATINGAGFELADGNLFLVAAEGGQCRVKQLKREIGDLKFERESLERFGKNDPDIVEFFTKGDKARSEK